MLCAASQWRGHPPRASTFDDATTLFWQGSKRRSRHLVGYLAFSDSHGVGYKRDDEVRWDSSLSGVAYQASFQEISEVCPDVHYLSTEKGREKKEKREKDESQINQSTSQSSRKAQRLHCDPSGRGKVLSVLSLSPVSVSVVYA